MTDGATDVKNNAAGRIEQQIIDEGIGPMISWLSYYTPELRLFYGFSSEKCIDAHKIQNFASISNCNVLALEESYHHYLDEIREYEETIDWLNEVEIRSHLYNVEILMGRRCRQSYWISQKEKE